MTLFGTWLCLFCFVPRPEEGAAAESIAVTVRWQAPSTDNGEPVSLYELQMMRDTRVSEWETIGCFDPAELPTLFVANDEEGYEAMLSRKRRNSMASQTSQSRRNSRSHSRSKSRRSSRARGSRSNTSNSRSSNGSDGFDEAAMAAAVAEADAAALKKDEEDRKEKAQKAKDEKTDKTATGETDAAVAVDSEAKDESKKNDSPGPESAAHIQKEMEAWDALITQMPTKQLRVKLLVALEKNTKREKQAKKDSEDDIDENDVDEENRKAIESLVGGLRRNQLMAQLRSLHLREVTDKNGHVVCTTTTHAYMLKSLNFIIKPRVAL